MAKGIDKDALVTSLEKQREKAQAKFDKAVEQEAGARKKAEAAQASLDRAQASKTEAQQTLENLKGQIEWAKAMPSTGSAPAAADADFADGATASAAEDAETASI